MISTYLKLDLMKNSKVVDSVDLAWQEDVYSLLQGFDDIDYAELIFVINAGSNMYESFVCGYRKIKLKGKKDYQWLACGEFDSNA